MTEPEQPVAEEPVVTEPTPEPVVDEEPKDEATNELSTNGATQDEPAADDDADETRDEVNDIRTNVARGAGVEAIGQPVQSLTEDESNGRGIGLMGILIGAGLAMPVALGAVLLRRRNG